MARSYAISLGVLALGLISLRGAIHGELASTVLTEGLVGMIGFIAIGYLIGSIADYITRQSVETRFRQRVDEVIQHIDLMNQDKEELRS